jgi:hypothetical protein
MTTCLKYCVPLACAMLVGTMLWTFVARGGLKPPAVEVDCKLRIANCKLQIEKHEPPDSWTFGNLQFAMDNLQFAISNSKGGRR